MAEPARRTGSRIPGMERPRSSRQPPPASPRRSACGRSCEPPSRADAGRVKYALDAGGSIRAERIGPLRLSVGQRARRTQTVPAKHVELYAETLPSATRCPPRSRCARSSPTSRSASSARRSPTRTAPSCSKESAGRTRCSRSEGSASALAELPLFQDATQDLARGRLRDGVDELDLARNLVVGEAALDEGDHVGGGQRLARLPDDERLGDLARLGMRLADHRGIGNRRMLQQERLDLGRGDTEALELDHLLLAVTDVEIAALVDAPDVTAVVPALAKRRRRRLGGLPVALHDLRTPDADLADLAGPEHALAGLDVDHPVLGVVGHEAGRVDDVEALVMDGVHV